MATDRSLQTVIKNFPQIGIGTPKALKKIKKLIADFQKTLSQIMNEAKTPEDQREAMRFMILHSSMISQGTGIPTIELVSDIIRKEFPHLKDELEKLLMLI